MNLQDYRIFENKRNGIKYFFLDLGIIKNRRLMKGSPVPQTGESAICGSKQFLKQLKAETRHAYFLRCDTDQLTNKRFCKLLLPLRGC